MKLIEKVNIEKLKKVCDKNLKNYPKKKPNQSSKWYNKSKTDLLNYLKKLDKNGIVEVLYSRKSEDIGGRLFSKGCIQHMPKEIRNYILDETLIDIDIKNCHPTIIHYLFKKYDIDDEFLSEYINDREKSLKKYGLLNKEELMYVFNNENISSKYHKDIKKFHKNIYSKDFGLLCKIENDYKKQKIPLYKNIKKYITNIKNRIMNINGSIFNHILTYYEDIILHEMIKFLESHSVSISVLMFDGIMVRKNDIMNISFLREMEIFVFDKTRINISLDLKNTKPEWEPIIEELEEEDDEEEENSTNKLEKFDFVKTRELVEEHWEWNEKGTKVIGVDINIDSKFMKYMNRYLCKFINPASYGFRLFENESYKMIKKQDLEFFLSNIVSGNRQYDTLYIYTKSPFIKIYDKCDFIIDYKNKDVIPNSLYNIYNLYQRPPSLYVENIEEKCPLFFNFIYEIISNSNIDLNELLLNWISYAIQKGKTKLALILKGIKRIGKGNFKQILINLIGVQYTFTDECGTRIGARFNGIEMGKLIVFYEEMTNNGEYNLKNEVMKNKITDKETVIELKNIEPFTSNNECNYVFISNNQSPMKIDRNEERFQVIKVNPKMKGKKEYFERLQKEVEDNIFGLRYYFENRQVKYTDLKIIETKDQEDNVWLNEDIRLKYISEKLDKYMELNDYKSTCKDIYEDFNNFCIDNCEYKRTNYRYFIDFIIQNSKYQKIVDKHSKKTYISL